MEAIIKSFFIDNWQRKLVAVITALIVWLFVNSSITDTKTIANVPIKLVDLPPNMTVVGMQPNGFLSKRINLTLSGTKDVINELEPGDVSVFLDASTANLADQNEWIVNITKKNILSNDPNVDLLPHITNVHHNELIIKLSRLVTAKIPITILPPIGEPPPGYEYLDYWPVQLSHEISGPDEEVQKLKDHGLDLTFNLSDITQKELDKVESSPGNFHNDEIRYLVPVSWKQISIPFHNNVLEEINDVEAQNLKIYFLRKQTLPLEQEIPISVFYPLQTSDTLNPETYKLATGKYLQIKNGIPVFTVPLYIKDVSKLFLHIVRDSLEISIVAAPPKERDFLEWSLEVINPNKLEDIYLAYSISFLNNSQAVTTAIPKKREEQIRKRFREYLQRMTLYVSPDKKLNLESILEDGKLVITGY